MILIPKHLISLKYDLYSLLKDGKNWSNYIYVYIHVHVIFYFALRTNQGSKIQMNKKCFHEIIFNN